MIVSVLAVNIFVARLVVIPSNITQSICNKGSIVVVAVSVLLPLLLWLVLLLLLLLLLLLDDNRANLSMSQCSLTASIALDLFSAQN